METIGIAPVALAIDIRTIGIYFLAAPFCYAFTGEI